MEIIDAILKDVRGNAKSLPELVNREGQFLTDFMGQCMMEARENFTWYLGQSDELLEFYTEGIIYAFHRNTLHNRNKKNYYWAQSALESGIKRVHSGLPKFIVDKLCSNIATPDIYAPNEQGKRLAEMLAESSIAEKLDQKVVPFTLVGGTCAVKPYLEDGKAEIKVYKEGSFCLLMDGDDELGCVFLDWISEDGKIYLVAEIRRTVSDEEGKHCKIEYKVFSSATAYDYKKLTPVNGGNVKFLKGKIEPLEIRGCKKPLYTLFKYFDDDRNKGHGLSIYAGKKDIFDSNDLALSQMYETIRVSTPIEYMNTDYLPRDANGNPMKPNTFFRHFIDITGRTNGDGQGEKAVEVSQPHVSIEQYRMALHEYTRLAIVGIMDPQTVGLDGGVDNADASREREKTTRRTVEIIRQRHSKSIKDLLRKCFVLEDAANGREPTPDFDITVKFPQFSAPNFESKARVLAPMYSSGSISAEQYVELLYGNEMSDKAKANEAKKLNQIRLFGQNQMGFVDENLPTRQADSGNKAENRSYEMRGQPQLVEQNAKKA